MGTVTVEVDQANTLARHIEDLQRVITKRNAHIAILEARLESGEESVYVAEAYERGRREGWKACASKLMRASSDVARLLTDLRETAFEQYLVGDRIGRTSVDAGPKDSSV